MNFYFKNKYFLIVIFVILLTLIGVAFFWGVFLRKQKELRITEKSPENNQLQQIISTPSQTPEFKIYRNEEFGFEFQCPVNWEIKTNIYKSPASKFNLIAIPLQDKYLPDPILINIVTSEFVNRAFSDLENIANEIVINGAIGKKYKYESESMQRISIILPFGEYKMILGAEKQYEDIFNQILASFKFLR